MVAPQSRKKTAWLRWPGYFALFLLVLWSIQWWQTRHLAGGAAPELAGPLLDGAWFELSERRGRPVLVHFWATWCPVCRLEQGAIDALAEDYPVVTVATRSGDAAIVRAYLIEQDLGFPVLLDETGVLAERWRVTGVPASFVIDGDGQIDQVVTGLTTGLALRARLWLAAGRWRIGRPSDPG